MKMKHSPESGQRMKRRKPAFVRQDAKRFKRLGTKWRKPRGIHSKMREHRKGHPDVVSVGYRTPQSLRGILGDGRTPVRVHNQDEVGRLDPKRHALILAASLGTRKRLALLAIAEQKGFALMDVGDPASRRAQIQKAWEERSRIRAERRRAERQKRPSAAEKQQSLPKAKQEKRDQAITPAPPKDIHPKEGEKQQREEQRREAEKVMIAP